MAKQETINLKEIGKLLLAIIICQLAGVIGSVFTFSSIPTWYAALTKPSFTPPNWVFGPVWITLYALIGIAVYLIYNAPVKNKQAKHNALMAFSAQLVLNALWSIIFFGMHWIFYGFVVIVLLWLAVLLTIIKFYKINKTAGWILIPYIVWLSLATALNYYVWILN